MRTLLFAALFVAVVAIVSACTPAEQQQQPPEEQAPEPEPEAEEQQQPSPEDYGISIISAPDTAEAGSDFTVNWQVRGPEAAIAHTAVHYDVSPHRGELGFEATPADSGYPMLTEEFKQGEFSIPREFEATITAPNDGAIFWRAHSIIEGNNYWTEERSIPVTPSPEPEPEAPSKQEFTLTADDDAFYQGGERVSSIEVAEGAPVKITFVVSESNTYFGGLDFRSDKFETKSISPGESTTVEFTADESFTITSYWPKSGARKADLKIMATE